MGRQHQQSHSHEESLELRNHLDQTPWVSKQELSYSWTRLLGPSRTLHICPQGQSWVGLEEAMELDPFLDPVRSLRAGCISGSCSK